MELGDKFFEMGRCLMRFKVFLACPGLANHHVVVDSRRLEDIVGNASFVVERFFNKLGGYKFQRLFLLDILNKEENI